jgi:hypothetical protein
MFIDKLKQQSLVPTFVVDCICDETNGATDDNET